MLLYIKKTEISRCSMVSWMGLNIRKTDILPMLNGDVYASVYKTTTVR